MIKWLLGFILKLAFKVGFWIALVAALVTFLVSKVNGITFIEQLQNFF